MRSHTRSTSVDTDSSRTVAGPHRRRKPHPLSLESLESRWALATLPSGFILEPAVSGLTAGVAFDFAPDGRIFIAEKGGVVKSFQQGTTNTFVDISSQVNNVHDRGLLGIAVHPSFPVQPYVYVLYTHDPPGLTADAGNSRVARLSRFTANSATNFTTAVAGSELVLLGRNSTAANIPQPNTRNPVQPACGNIGAYVQDCIPADEISHTIGTVKFGRDGALYVGSGDGGNFTAAQNYVVRAIDPNSLAGKILRIDPATGNGLADNPFFDGNPASNRSKVYSQGLRNPFRFTIDPLTGEPYIGDVGWGSWEEINVGRGANFGWPCYEGGNGTSLQQGSYSSFAQCQTLYASGNVQPAIYAYNHAAGSSSVQVGDFYQGTTYPAPYRDALFFLDYNRQVVWTMPFNAQRQPGTVTSFATSIGGVTQMSTGPDTNLYWMDILAGRLNRLRYVAGGNTPPTAVASVNQLSATTFQFSSQGSFDPDAQALSYLWNFGDGQTSTQPNPTHTYTVSGPRTAVLTVTDPGNLSGTDSVSVVVNNNPPTAQILTPANGSRYRIGNTIQLSGRGTDPEDGTLPGTRLTWDVRIHHNDHVHFNFFNGTGTNASFVATDHDDNSFLEICLTATDSLNVGHTSCITVRPEEVNYTLTTSPAGLRLTYSGVDIIGPNTLTVPVNAQRTITAPLQQSGLTFARWSDGGARSHNITIGTSAQTLTATYGSQIVVRAAGDTGNEQIQLQINQQPVATFNVTTQLTNYTYVHTSRISPGQIRVVFLNDVYNPPIDYNVRVDQITVDGLVLQTESPSVLSTGTWDGTCNPGFKQSEMLHCSGYFQYANPTTPSTITVTAAGDTGEEIIELQVDLAPVATFSLSTTPQNFSHTYAGPLSADRIRVAFVNDAYNPPLDRNAWIDKIVLNGTTYQTEHPAVLSVGVWNGNCGPGFKQNELLACGGFFEYSAAGATPPPLPPDSGRARVAIEPLSFVVRRMEASFAQLSQSLQASPSSHQRAASPVQESAPSRANTGRSAYRRKLQASAVDQVYGIWPAVTRRPRWVNDRPK